MPGVKAAEPLLSCTIITTDAVGELAEIHDRMPLTISKSDWDRWLDPDASDVDALAHLLQPASDDLLLAYPVGTAVNSADNDGPELVERVELEPSLGL